MKKAVYFLGLFCVFVTFSVVKPAVKSCDIALFRRIKSDDKKVLAEVGSAF
ncbi:MAG: hypothetical protein P9X27_06735 [Candidatus Kaelpia aquatica]|nr:hypothetical protein [Candidatus Kaelpia aquatica]